ncbi:DUF3043 domain-containing protein [Nocardioides terrisoli]|uniref:DUF3043 domain-containing protein n=1 Tax=Nocardioides terrisoli TaxID=3388267 RepID=UPI00287B6DB9|nr:DUF3043 domain-containing protein [Nocardioides marmorisolisilvae]
MSSTHHQATHDTTRQQLFGRSDKKATTPSATQEKEGGKGRPTPTRKEAEAAARERARAVADKKGARQRRSSDTRKMREAMRSGDERYLPARDQGPVKRFVRDFVDSRLCFAEFLLPLLIVIMVLSYSGSHQASSFGNGLWTATILLVIVDTGWMIVRLRRALRAKFPDESLRGVNFYAITRVIQMRFMRMPKAKVGIGGKPK